MIEVITPDGTHIFLDPAFVQRSYGGIAVRVTTDAEIEVLVPGEEGLEWLDISEVDPVSTQH